MSRIPRPIPVCQMCARPIFGGETLCHVCKDKPVAPVPPEPPKVIDPDTYEITDAPPDMVNHPPHYQSGSGIECIDAIEAMLTPEEFRGYCKGNALKYTWREKYKGGDQDLAKAAWYLNRLQR